jgi:SAM-dependent methyltransferase
LEGRHWWWRGRRRIVLDVIGRVARRQELDRALDIGCGAGYLLESLHGVVREGVGIEPDEGLRGQANRRLGLAGSVHAGHLPDGLPEGLGEFDLVLALDVLEHVEDDAAACAALKGLTRAGGHVVVTVPAMPFLYGPFDALNGHFRRYRLGQLVDLVAGAGLVIERATYVNFLLFPLLCAQRLWQRVRAPRSAVPGIPPAVVNAPLMGIFGLERFLIRAARLPWGGSILCAAVRPR